MFKILPVLLALSLIGCASPRPMHSKAEMMKKMDSNGDGVISREEFMSHHEAKYDKMKKNRSGMVDLSDTRVEDTPGKAGTHDHTAAPAKP